MSLNDNGYYGEGNPYYITDVIAVNVTSINDDLSIYSTESSTWFIVKSGFSVPLNGLQIEDVDLNVTNTELLLVNISVNHNKIGLYVIDGLHFTDLSSGNQYERTNRYSSLNFYGTMYNINNALSYLYYHSTNESYCGDDIVDITVSYQNEIVNTTLNVNVTCS